jgi:hypothetical protein
VFAGLPGGSTEALPMPQQRIERVGRQGLAGVNAPNHARAMFVLTEAQAAEIRTAYECVRTIAGWQPLLTRPSVMPLSAERRTLRKPPRSRKNGPP